MTGVERKAWGIGLSRTGTTTFCAALTLLGYKRVAHNPTFQEFTKLDGAADNECVLYYKYLDYRFPGSKFILTIRELEAWLDSMKFIMNRHPVVRDGPRPDGAVSPRKFDVAIKRRMLIYETVGFEREKLVSAYHRHHEDVRRYFKDRPDDLLEMNISEGAKWDALCPFLGVPRPTEPFPHQNSRAILSKRKKGRLKGPLKRLNRWVRSR